MNNPTPKSSGITNSFLILESEILHLEEQLELSEKKIEEKEEELEELKTSGKCRGKIKDIESYLI